MLANPIRSTDGIKRFLALGAARVVVGATTGCSAPDKASSTRPVEVTATSRQALATSNGALRASGRAEGPRDVSRGKDIQ
jgi:hypothetical protein